ncbi:hypothetical protein VNI00_012461 [Paramarasmius palmivorus]|uniref:DJ-1/PfpI domain-containing protein n=1 Tax=Paramarasmius palmivorus TaxID=297713 RepID=A0AAW0C5N2_9AGAR
MSSEQTVYRLAVCLYPDVAALDYQGPIEMLGGFSTELQARFGHYYKTRPSCAINVEFLSHTKEPVKPVAGPGLVPTLTYKEAMETDIDIILIPGGANSDPKALDPSLLEFLKKRGPLAKHILAVCTGSWVLAGSGLLNGKRATTNKAVFRLVVEATKDLNITWVPKARWVVSDDKHIWTASGVTSGMDLANAFLEYFVGEKFAEQVRGLIELRAAKDSSDDEYATYYGLA